MERIDYIKAGIIKTDINKLKTEINELLTETLGEALSPSKIGEFPEPGISKNLLKLWELQDILEVLENKNEEA